MLLLAVTKLSCTRRFYYGVTTVLLASIIFAFAGEFETVLAWWSSILLLLPPLLVAFQTPYVSLRTVCGISFLTQFITLPFFFLYKDDFVWGHVKPFHFTASEAFPILTKVSLFLCVLVICFKFFYPILFFGGSSLKYNKAISLNNITQDRSKISSFFEAKKNRHKLLFSLLLILLLLLLVPLCLWSYSQGIGLTGVQSASLPYRLSGIIFYLTKYITPAILVYFYSKTNRGWPLMLLILAYSLVLGLTSVSKASVLFLVLPVLILALLDKRIFMFGVAFIGMLVGISFSSLARTYVYIVTDGKTGADTSNSIIKLIVNIITVPDSPVFKFDFFPRIIISILSRVESFENLVLAQYYDPDAVIGAWGFILRMIGLGGADFDIDSHMMQWQGNLLPEGFVNTGALLSNAVIVGNAGLWWVIVSAMATSVCLIILEKSSDRLACKFTQYAAFNVPVIFFLTAIFFSSSGASSVIFCYPFLLILLSSFLPKTLFKNRLRW